MPSLANLLENYRNWKGRQDWQSGKEMQDYFGGDPVAQEQFEQLSGFGTGSHGVQGGLAGMIKASHGGPHAFEKFDFSKIGSGEGAQAYGHGGYFAQGFDSPVAKEYQKQLSEDVFDVAGTVFDPSTLEHLNVRSAARRGDLDAAISKAKEIALSDSPVADMAKSDLSTLLEIKSKGGLKPAQGHLYNVELKWPDAAKEAADPLGEHHLLDWDAPYANQPSKIQELLKNAYENVYGNRSSTRQRLMEKFAAAGKQAPIREEMSPITGQQLYDNLATQFGSREAASDYLASGGIPGIRYLDQASRGAGTGSRNYVMFDDRFPEIVSHNGVSLSDLLRR